MKTPVLIAAHQEEANIGRTLHHLDPETMHPMVIVNGSTDRTAEIARSFGATVIEREEPGKLQALQAGIRGLGNAATEPFITLDAETFPLFPRRYVSGMLAARAACDPHKPAAVAGMSIYAFDRDPVRCALSTVRHYRHHKSWGQNQSFPSFCGRNALFDLSNASTVDEVLAMPPIWPGEDEAMKDVVVIGHNGNVNRATLLNTACLTSGRRETSIWMRLTQGREASRADSTQSYLNDQAEGSTRYVSYEETVLQ